MLTQVSMGHTLSVKHPVPGRRYAGRREEQGQPVRRLSSPRGCILESGHRRDNGQHANTSEHENGGGKGMITFGMQLFTTILICSTTVQRLLLTINKNQLGSPSPKGFIWRQERTAVLHVQR